MASASLTTNPFAHMIDPSTPQTLSATLTNAAAAARVEANVQHNKAIALRQDAAALANKAGMDETRASLLREAAQADETSGQYIGMAAGWETRADSVISTL
jgi:hypothetical protein